MSAPDSQAEAAAALLEFAATLAELRLPGPPPRVGRSLPAFVRELARQRGQSDVWRALSGESTAARTVRSEVSTATRWLLPHSARQREAAALLANESVVVIDGADGTGKTQTLANLLGQFAEQGRRVLVIGAEGSLQTLHQRLPDRLRANVIALYGVEWLTAPDAAVEITERALFLSKPQADDVLAQQERDIDRRERELAELSAQALASRRRETESVAVAGGAFEGVPAAIIQRVRAEAAQHHWLRDAIPETAPLPIEADDWVDLQKGLRQEANLALPRPALGELPSLDDFDRIAANLRDGEDSVKKARAEADADILAMLEPREMPREQLADLIRRVGDLLERRSAIRNEALRSVSAAPEFVSDPNENAWLDKAIEESLGQHAIEWLKLRNDTERLVRDSAPRVRAIDQWRITYPKDVTPAQLWADAEELRRLKAGTRGPDWLGQLRPARLKLSYIARDVRISGEPCNTPERLSRLIESLKLRLEFDKLTERWVKRGVRAFEGTLADRLDRLNDLLQAFVPIVDLRERAERILAELRTFVPPNEDGERRLVVERWPALLQALYACQHIFDLRESQRQSGEWIERLRQIGQAGPAHPVVANLIAALQRHDAPLYRRSLDTLEALEHAALAASRARDLLARLGQVAPLLAETLGAEASSPAIRPYERLSVAWRFAQTRTWADRFIREPRERARSNYFEVRRIQDAARQERLAGRVERLFADRVSERHRQRLHAWKALESAGLPRGAHGSAADNEPPLFRGDETDPGGVLPLWFVEHERIGEVFEPRTELFDLVLVDDAHQCGLEFLPLLLLGRRVVLAGDSSCAEPDFVVDRQEFETLRMRWPGSSGTGQLLRPEMTLIDWARLGRAGVVSLSESFRATPRGSEPPIVAPFPTVPPRDERQDTLPPAPFRSWLAVEVARSLAERGYWLSVPKHGPEVAARVDLRIDGKREALGIVCEACTWDGAESFPSVLERQHDLQQSGWRLWFVRESSLAASPQRRWELLCAELDAAGALNGPVRPEPPAPEPPRPVVRARRATPIRHASEALSVMPPPPADEERPAVATSTPMPELSSDALPVATSDAAPQRETEIAAVRLDEPAVDSPVTPARQAREESESLADASASSPVVVESEWGFAPDESLSVVPPPPATDEEAEVTDFMTDEGVSGASDIGVEAEPSDDDVIVIDDFEEPVEPQDEPLQPDALVSESPTPAIPSRDDVDAPRIPARPVPPPKTPPARQPAEPVRAAPSFVAAQALPGRDFYEDQELQLDDADDAVFQSAGHDSGFAPPADTPASPAATSTSVIPEMTADRQQRAELNLLIRLRECGAKDRRDEQGNVTRMDLNHARGIQAADIALLGLFDRLRELIMPASTTDEMLRRLPVLARLVSLDLGFTAVSDHGLERLPVLNSLRSLDLRHTLVTDECLPVLERQDLEWLNVDGTSISRQRLDQFREQHPWCELPPDRTKGE